MLPPPRPQAPAGLNADDAVRQTDDDAAASRLSAVSLGYLDDPYASLLYRARGFRTDPSGLPTRPFGPPTTSPFAAPSGPNAMHKSPLINIGTHHRTAALDRVVDSFLSATVSSPRPAQIVSIGAGSDTRFWRLMGRKSPPRIGRYVELDFPQLTSMKAQRIARSPKLASALKEGLVGQAVTSSEGTLPTTAQASMAPSPSPAAGPYPTTKPYTISQGGAALTSSIYALRPLDLREPGALDTHVAPLLDPLAPTLVIAECVLCYMPPELGRAVIGWFGRMPEVGLVVYEMCGLNDAFGKVMKRNLALRSLSIPGAEPFSTPQSQAERFLSPQLGEGVLERSGVMTLWDIREIIGRAELARISRLEMLDEIEELRLVLSHYIVAWGTKGQILAGVGL